MDSHVRTIIELIEDGESESAIEELHRLDVKLKRLADR